MSEIKKKDIVPIIVISAVVLVFVVFLIFIWKAGYFQNTGDDSSAKIIAATIVLIGGFFGAIITLLGLLFKRSVDLRSVAIQERSEKLAADAERRLKIEAAIQSINLLSTSSGSEVPDVQKAGVILSLGNLEMFGIALSLSYKMMKEKSLDIGTLCWLVNKAVANGSQMIKTQAILLLRHYITEMASDVDRPVFPVILHDKETVLGLELSARGVLGEIYIDLSTYHPRSEMDTSYLAASVETLYILWKNEVNGFRKNQFGCALYYISGAFREGVSYSFDGESINMKSLVNKMKTYKSVMIAGKSPINGLSRMQNLKDWAEK